MQATGTQQLTYSDNQEQSVIKKSVKNPTDLIRAWRLSLIMSSLQQQQQIQNMVHLVN